MKVIDKLLEGTTERVITDSIIKKQKKVKEWTSVHSDGIKMFVPLIGAFALGYVMGHKHVMAIYDKVGKISCVTVIK